MASNFEIKAVIINGLNVSGYLVSADDNPEKTQEVNVVDIIKLAKSKRITNAETILDVDSGEYVLSIDEGLSNIQKVRNTKGSTFNILCRIVDADDKCVGYKVTDNSGKTYRLSNRKLWDLAINNFVNDIEALIINNKKVIRSIGDNKLESLTRVKV